MYSFKPENCGRNSRLIRALCPAATLLILIAWSMTCATFAATIPSPYELATWRGFRASAVSYTFDDNSPKQFSVAQPMFDAKGLHATFFCIVGNLSAAQWTTIESASAQGHEIGSHTLTHPDLTTLTDAQVANEESGSKNLIESHTGKPCISLAYPYCTVPNRSITSQYYSFARSCNGSLVPSTPSDFLSIGSMGPEGDMNAKADNAASSGSWLVWLIHGIDNDAACCPLASSVLQANLNYVTANTNNWWIETFGNVCRYIKERNAAVLTVVSSTSTNITLSLTDNLDNSTYNYPVTLRRTLPSGWTSATVTQNGSTVPSSVSGGYITFDVVPDAGNIVLATNGGGGGTPPSAPTNLSASPIGKKKISLNWTQSTSPNVTQNKIYRSTTGSGGPYSLRTTISATTTFTDTGLTSGQQYFYVVTAVNGSGQESPYSSYSGATPR